MPKSICVVLNSQHQRRVDDFVQRCNPSTEARMLFQPYFTKHLARLHELATPVPIYLVSGQYGTGAVAVGELMKVEYRDEIPRIALEPLKELLPVTDIKVDRANLLYLAHGRLLRAPVPLDQFRKISDGQPLQRGKWTAVVCSVPNRIPGAAPPSKRDTSDDPEQAFEGHLRVLFLRHRRREQKLRGAKIRAMLRSTGHLKCEVTTCSFDFEEVYGVLGQQYAHVHHLRPLASQDGPRRTALKDLAIVCPNCHAMIHRGGACRRLAEISSSISEMRSKGLG